jgi:hypothetical protein
MRQLIVLVTVMALFTGCSKQQGIELKARDQQDMKASQPNGEEQENLDICEAVFRYQFKHNASFAQQNADAYFIMIFKQDPSDTFLARFAGNTPPVRKGSDFVIGKGLVFSIGSINRIDENTAQVYGGIYEAGLSSSGNLYTVVRKSGKWLVAKDEMQWISQAVRVSPVLQTSRAQVQTGDQRQFAINTACPSC